MPLEFYDLPYSADALQPHIDKTTMEIHHGKHRRLSADDRICHLVVISAVVFAMMDFHRGFVYMWLQGVRRVGQVVKFQRHRFLLVVGEYQLHYITFAAVFG